MMEEESFWELEHMGRDGEEFSTFAHGNKIQLVRASMRPEETRGTHIFQVNRSRTFSFIPLSHSIHQNSRQFLAKTQPTFKLTNSLNLRC